MKSEPELAKVMAPAPAKYPGSGSKTLDYAGTGINNKFINTDLAKNYKYSLSETIINTAFGKQL